MPIFILVSLKRDCLPDNMLKVFIFFALGFFLCFFPWLAFGYGPNCYAPLEMASFLSKPKKKRSPLVKKQLALRDKEKQIDRFSDKMSDRAAELGASLDAAKLGEGEDPYDVASEIRDYIESQQNGWDCATAAESASAARPVGNRWRNQFTDMLSFGLSPFIQTKAFRFCGGAEKAKPYCSVNFMASLSFRYLKPGFILDSLIPQAHSAEPHSAEETLPSSTVSSDSKSKPFSSILIATAIPEDSTQAVSNVTVTPDSGSQGIAAAVEGNNKETDNKETDDEGMCERTGQQASSPPGGPAGRWTSEQCICPSPKSIFEAKFCVCRAPLQWRDGSCQCPTGQREMTDNRGFITCTLKEPALSTAQSNCESATDNGGVSGTWGDEKCTCHSKSTFEEGKGCMCNHPFTPNTDKDKCECPDGQRLIGIVCVDTQADTDDDVSTACVNSGGTWRSLGGCDCQGRKVDSNGKCTDQCKNSNYQWNSEQKKCVPSAATEPESEPEPEAEVAETDCPVWKQDPAFGRGGRVQEGFCDRFASSPSSCKKALKKIKKLAKQINNASQEYADLEDELNDIEFSTEDIKKSLKTEAQSVCFECLKAYWDRSRPTTGQTVGSLLTTLTGVGMGAVGYRLGKSADEQANQLRISQGYDVQNDNYWLSGMGAGYPFVAKGLYGLTKPNSPMGGYVCSPSTPYSPYGHYNSLY